MWKAADREKSTSCIKEPSKKKKGPMSNTGGL